jgi:hypothetical protein
MTTRTRRTVLIALVAVALMLPVETILIRALSAPDEQSAARQWAEALSTTGLETAANDIQAYPFTYRKEIMRALTPAGRAATWSAHLQAYLDAQPGLNPAAVAVIEELLAVTTADNFANPNAALSEQVAGLAAEVEQLLGREEAEYLLYRLGPPDGSFASREPVVERLANAVRGWFVVLARIDDCNCSTGFGCDGFYTHCSDEHACTPDTEWPACGWLWMQDCDGMCATGAIGGI